MEMRELIIVGSGPSGLTAGIYAGRAKLQPLIISGKTFGGMISKLKIIENYPGFSKPINGQTLINNMKQQALKSGATIVNDTIKDFYVTKDKKILISENGVQYNAKVVIFATGLNKSQTTFEGENEFLGHGISTCTTCDGPLYKNKIIAIYGDSANILNDIIYLSNIANKIFFIPQNNQLKLINKIKKINNVKILNDTTIISANGDNILGLKSITIKNNITKNEETLNIDGVFLINDEENNALLFQNKILTTPRGLILTKENSCMTNIDGVFAIGDVKNGNIKQISNACASAVEAIYEIRRFLSFSSDKQ